MGNLQIENELLKQILQKKVYNRSFNDIVKDFDKKLKEFNPINNNFRISEYFRIGSGNSGAIKNLIKDGKIKEEWIKVYKTKSGIVRKDIKGLYVFLYNNIPFYVGISKGVLNRLIQHTKGHSHFNSTLAYNIALLNYEIREEKKYGGTRGDFDFKKEVIPIRNFLFEQNAAVFPVQDDDELYLFEIYCAMNLQTWLNKFETH